MSTFTQNKPVVLSVGEWSPSANKYMVPKINDRGGKSINLLSKQTNRSLHISTPLLMTWGISDYIDEKGESDGKYSISLTFPNSEYENASTKEFLQKLKDFENQILDDAVKNSELWWGEEMSRELCKHTFFPFLKYSKNKDTKKIDTSKPPSIRAKVPYYNEKWAVELYDTQSNLIFPCDDPTRIPPDFVPKMSNIACVLQCGGIWIGGKGWGLTWKMVQGVVKPREIVSVYGRCHIQLSNEDINVLEKQVIPKSEDEDENDVEPAAVDQTVVEDSDEEVEEEPVEKVPEPVVEKVAPVKKIVKKAVAPSPVVEPPVEKTEDAPKKKIIKKKA
jgi:hypothetical protein